MFESAKLKVEWANINIRELNKHIEAYSASQYYTCFIDKQPETGGFIFGVRYVKQPPKYIPLLIGAAIHSLRSALDYVVCDIVRRVETPSRNCRLPFLESREKLVSKFRGGQIERTGGEALINLILDEIRPYREGEDAALVALHDLDIIEKHELLIPTFHVTRVFNVGVFDRRTLSGAEDCVVDLGPGGEMQIMEFGPESELKLQQNTYAAFSIFFDKAHPLGGQPVIPALHQLSQLVSGAINTFEKFCAAN